MSEERVPKKAILVFEKKEEKQWSYPKPGGVPGSEHFGPQKPRDRSKSQQINNWASFLSAGAKKKSNLCFLPNWF